MFGHEDRRLLACARYCQKAARVNVFQYIGNRQSEKERKEGRQKKFHEPYQYRVARLLLSHKNSPRFHFILAVRRLSVINSMPE